MTCSVALSTFDSVNLRRSMSFNYCFSHSKKCTPLPPFCSTTSIPSLPPTSLPSLPPTSLPTLSPHSPSSFPQVSDDEDDTHPNVDTASLFRWRHQARMERMEKAKEEKEEFTKKTTE